MEFRELLARVLREQDGLEGLEVREVREVECTEPGDNFMSDVTVAEVRGELPAAEPYLGRVFVKRPPGSATGRALGSDAAFANEALVYGRLLGDVTVCARCLHASHDVILLQDLADQGYRMPRRPQGLTPSAVPTVLQALAKFHGASYVRLQTSEAFREGVTELRPMGLLLSGSGNETLKTALGRMQGLAAEGAESLSRLLVDASTRLRMLRRPGPVAVLAHGDFWLNNIMLNEKLEEPVKIIDLQACAVASPAVDVWTLLYTSVDPSILQDQVEPLVDHYCDSFLDVLRQAGVPSDSVPTAATLKQDLLWREQYGLYAAAVYLPALFISCPRDEVLRAGSLEGVLDMGQLEARTRSLLAVSSRRGVLDGI